MSLQRQWRLDQLTEVGEFLSCCCDFFATVHFPFIDDFNGVSGLPCLMPPESIATMARCPRELRHQRCWGRFWSVPLINWRFVDLGLCIAVQAATISKYATMLMNTWNPEFRSYVAMKHIDILINPTGEVRSELLAIIYGDPKAWFGDPSLDRLVEIRTNTLQYVAMIECTFASSIFVFCLVLLLWKLLWICFYNCELFWLWSILILLGVSPTAGG